MTALHLLMPKEMASLWDVWEKNIMKYETPFMEDRDQPTLHQARDEGFTRRTAGHAASEK